MGAIRATRISSMIMKALVRKVGARLWVSGHTHTPFDYEVGQTRVIGNPRGYRERDGPARVFTHEDSGGLSDGG